MTLPHLPRIIPADGFAAILNACIHTVTPVKNTHTETCACAQRHKLCALQLAPHAATQKEYAPIDSRREPPQPRYK